MLYKLIDRLKKSEEFKKFKREHKEAYLISFFFIDKWEIDYYDEKIDRVFTFSIDDIIKVRKDKVFRSDESNEIEKLDIGKVKISLDDALKKINNGKNKIVILQMFDKGAIWNISYLDGLDLVNVKIDAENGEIVSEKKGSLVESKKK